MKVTTRYSLYACLFLSLFSIQAAYPAPANVAILSGFNVSQHYGVEIGYEHYEIQKGLRYGHNSGLSISYPVGEKLRIRKDVAFVNKGSTQDIRTTDGYLSFKVRYNTDYLEIPTFLELDFYRNHRYSFYTLSGFSFSYMLKAHYTIDGSVSVNNEQLPIKIDKNISKIDRFDFGVIVGGGWKLTTRGLFLEYKANFSTPFIDLPTTEDITGDQERVPLRNISYTISLGYVLF